MAEMTTWHVGGAAALAIVVVLLARETIAPSVYGVCTVGYNYRERPIYVFGVSTKEARCGNFASAKKQGSSFPGGGAVARGCVVRPGEQAIVKWTFDQPLSEIEKHVPEETHEVQVAIPQPKSRKSRYLQVHFLADNHAVLDWRDELDSRLNPVTESVDEQQH